MYFADNPVLQRELLVNLRSNRLFLLLAGYQIVLAGLVLLAWPSAEKLDLSTNPPSAKNLVHLFFLGQYVIASLMAPSFSAGTITGEKERKTFEMLLASPLRPAAMVLGKMVASLTQLGMLIFASLPIIVLCLPLGGVSVYEVVAAYVGLIISVTLFGAIGVACSSYFRRTSASLVVSYLMVLPLVMGGVLFWIWLEDSGTFRLQMTLLVIPAFCLTAVLLLCANAAGRMLYPPDMGSEGKEVVDLEKENEEAIGMVIQRDQWPDSLFAPKKKEALLADGDNPIYDKELHSEIFSQGTLMLRLVVQISMALAILLMAVFLFAFPHLSPWFVVYVIVFNMLVGPVFLAGALTGERERQTLDLLLTTMVTPWQILWGKLIPGYRVSAVLTAFLIWPLGLGAALVSTYYSNIPSILMMFFIVVLVSVTNSLLAMCCSAYSKRTSIALISTYVIMLVLYTLPMVLVGFLQILNAPEGVMQAGELMGVTSPFSALFSLPLDFSEGKVEWQSRISSGNIVVVLGYICFTAALIGSLFSAIIFKLGRRDGIINE